MLIQVCDFVTCLFQILFQIRLFCLCLDKHVILQIFSLTRGELGALLQSFLLHRPYINIYTYLDLLQIAGNIVLFEAEKTIFNSTVLHSFAFSASFFTTATFLAVFLTYCNYTFLPEDDSRVPWFFLSLFVLFSLSLSNPFEDLLPNSLQEKSSSIKEKSVNELVDALTESALPTNEKMLLWYTIYSNYNNIIFSRFSAVLSRVIEHAFQPMKKLFL